MITVGANLDGGKTTAEVTPAIQKTLSDLTLPAGITWQFSGQQAQAQNAYAALILAFLMGLIFVYMVLASQFGSFIHPFTVMISLPLAIIGSVLALVIIRSDLTIIYMIGYNSDDRSRYQKLILLVDFIISTGDRERSGLKPFWRLSGARLRPDHDDHNGDHFGYDSDRHWVWVSRSFPSADGDSGHRW